MEKISSLWYVGVSKNSQNSAIERNYLKHSSFQSNDPCSTTFQQPQWFCQGFYVLDSQNIDLKVPLMHRAQPKVIACEVQQIHWLWHECSFFFCHELLHCYSMTWGIVRVQDPSIMQYIWSFSFLRIAYANSYKIPTSFRRHCWSSTSRHSLFPSCLKLFHCSHQ